ncbi:MAG: G-D-S-L family lipolytic protein [Sphingobacteriales bacterium]|nr:G-D-S-L family lipolytic protein [Sphingobacteriales bacterium]
MAQDKKPDYWEDIQKFKQQDSIAMPKPNQILFIGSSSFTKWTDVQDYFPKHKILNRAFGGSTLKDVIYRADDVIFKYQPNQIVIYFGENDLAYDSTLYPAQVAERFFQLFTMIRSKYKKIPVIYVSMKPSPSRKNLMAKYNVANVMIKNFLASKRKTRFIDVYHHMLMPDGTPLDDIFTEDKLHMNAKGYKIWQKLLKPYLK